MGKGKRTIEERSVTREELAENCEEMIELVAKRKCIFVITKEGKPFVMMTPAPRMPRLRKPTEG
jgi:hypothetical protein